VAVEDGYRESEDSWASVFRNLRDRGLNEPKLMTGDGALGAWAALQSVFPGAREQRCWVHKTANVLDALPQRLQPRAKSLLHEISRQCALHAHQRRACRKRRDHASTQSADCSSTSTVIESIHASMASRGALRLSRPTTS
jgi:transposase-like protein